MKRLFFNFAGLFIPNNWDNYIMMMPQWISDDEGSLADFFNKKSFGPKLFRSKPLEVLAKS
jgi:hypothetical protein